MPSSASAAAQPMRPHAMTCRRRPRPQRGTHGRACWAGCLRVGAGRWRPGCLVAVSFQLNQGGAAAHSMSPIRNCRGAVQCRILRLARHRGATGSAQLGANCIDAEISIEPFWPLPSRAGPISSNRVFGQAPAKKAAACHSPSIGATGHNRAFTCPSRVWAFSSTVARTAGNGPFFAFSVPGRPAKSARSRGLAQQRCHQPRSVRALLAVVAGGRPLVLPAKSRRSTRLSAQAAGSATHCDRGGEADNSLRVIVRPSWATASGPQWNRRPIHLPIRIWRSIRAKMVAKRTGRLDLSLS